MCMTLLSVTVDAGWLNDYSTSARWTVGLLVGSIALAASPASAIAVVRELHASGPFTSLSLGVTVVAELVVLALFTITSALAFAVCTGSGFYIIEFLVTVSTLVAALLIGWLTGFLFLPLLRQPHAPYLKFAILPAGLLITMLCDWVELYTATHWHLTLNFDALLICIAAAAHITNRSEERMQFLAMMARCGPFIFIPFFTLVGAQLNLNVLWKSIGFALVMFFVRAACLALGGWVGGKMSALSMEQRRTFWLTQLSQAGVCLGLASEVSVKFDDSFGVAFQTAIVACVIINQLIGPIACRYAIKRAGEAQAHGIENEGDAKQRAESQANNGLDASVELHLSDDVEAGSERSSTDSDARPRSPSRVIHQTSHRTRHDAAAKSRPCVTLVNLRGARLTRSADSRRALIIGINGRTLAVAKRLLDRRRWSIVVLDENEARVRQAERVLRGYEEQLERHANSGLLHRAANVLHRASEMARHLPDHIAPMLDSLVPRQTDSDSASSHTSIHQPNSQKADADNDIGESSVAGGDSRSAESVKESEADVAADMGAIHPSSTSSSSMVCSKIGSLRSSDKQYERLDGEKTDEYASEPAKPTALAPLHIDSSDNTSTNSLASPSQTHPGLRSPRTRALSSPLPTSPRVHIERVCADLHPTLLDSYMSLEDDLFLTPEGIDCVLISLSIDTMTYDLARHLTQRRRFANVIAHIHHPAWNKVMAQLGVVPLHSFSAETHLLTQLMTASANDIAEHDDANSDGHDLSSVHFTSSHSLSDMVSMTDSLSMSRSQWMHMAATVRDEEEDWTDSLMGLTPHRRSEYQRVHRPPPPHLANVGTGVVAECDRDEYVNAIMNIHVGVLIGGKKEKKKRLGSPMSVDSINDGNTGRIHSTHPMSASQFAYLGVSGLRHQPELERQMTVDMVTLKEKLSRFAPTLRRSQSNSKETTKRSTTKPTWPASARYTSHHDQSTEFGQHKQTADDSKV